MDYSKNTAAARLLIFSAVLITIVTTAIYTTKLLEDYSTISYKGSANSFYITPAQFLRLPSLESLGGYFSEDDISKVEVYTRDILLFSTELPTVNTELTQSQFLAAKEYFKNFNTSDSVRIAAYPKQHNLSSLNFEPEIIIACVLAGLSGAGVLLFLLMMLMSSPIFTRPITKKTAEEIYYAALEEGGDVNNARHRLATFEFEKIRTNSVQMYKRLKTIARNINNGQELECLESINEVTSLCGQVISAQYRMDGVFIESDEKKYSWFNLKEILEGFMTGDANQSANSLRDLVTYTVTVPEDVQVIMDENILDILNNSAYAGGHIQSDIESIHTGASLSGSCLHFFISFSLIKGADKPAEKSQIMRSLYYLDAALGAAGGKSTIRNINGRVEFDSEIEMIVRKAAPATRPYSGVDVHDINELSSFQNVRCEGLNILFVDSDLLELNDLAQSLNTDTLGRADVSLIVTTDTSQAIGCIEDTPFDVIVMQGDIKHLGAQTLFSFHKAAWPNSRCRFAVVFNHGERPELVDSFNELKARVFNRVPTIADINAVMGLALVRAV